MIKRFSTQHTHIHVSGGTERVRHQGRDEEKRRIDFSKLIYCILYYVNGSVNKLKTEGALMFSDNTYFV